MSCALGIIAVPSGGKTGSDVGVSVGMGHLLIDSIYEILEIVKILETEGDVCLRVAMPFRLYAPGATRV
jgi:hypothetical protein